MTNTKFNIAKLNTYLNSNEISELEYLNQQVDKANQSINDRTDIMNLSLNMILKNWANVNSQVFAEIVVFVSGLDKYKEYIDDEDNNSFLIAFKHFFVDLLQIFTKDGRLLYIGLTFILISILIYFIGITS